MNIIHPTAVNYLGISGVMLFRIIFAVSIILFLYAIYKRIAILKRTGADPRFKEWGKRLSGLIADGFLQRRQPRYMTAGILHATIFWGFLVLLLRSVQLIAESLSGGVNFNLLSGTPNDIYLVVKDFTELIVLIACITAIIRRAVIKPERYKGSNQFEAFLVLGVIALLMITDVFYDAIGGVHAGGKVWSPVSATVSALLSTLRYSDISTIHIISYWLHIISFFLLLNLLPISKHFHIITALPNVAFRKLNRGELKPPNWQTPSLLKLDSAGAGQIEDFTWKQVLDLFSCTECGRCTDNCPANTVGRNLSPKQLIMKLRDLAYWESPIWGPREKVKADRSLSIVGDAVDPTEIWSCTTCGACEEQCPVFIEHVDKIVELRRHEVLMKSSFPPELLKVFRNIETYGDPWGMGCERRLETLQDQSVKMLDALESADLVYWIGCAGAFDRRYANVAQSLIKLLNWANVNFGVLGKFEKCCGDFARRMGTEYLFQKMAVENIKTLKAHGVKKIVVSCPHGYNTLKNEYPKYGGEFEVIHHTRFIMDLIDSGKIEFTQPVDKQVVYHDSCYLGRYNGVYDLPRQILTKVPGLKLVEAARSREKGFCCGAGGGFMWLVETGSRVNENRANEMVSLKPELISTACPFCMYMLAEGINTLAQDASKPEVVDIIEIVEKAL